MELPAHDNVQPLPPLTVPLYVIRHMPLKRAFDLFFSLGILLLGAPIYLAIALAIKLTSRGPIFYAQERVGRGGKLFKCFKFRTMHPDADAILQDLLTTDPAVRAEWTSRRKLSNDPRTTSLGRFLRRTSIDELPQFLNVLIGDLSVVGPRPVCPDEITAFYRAKAYKVLSVRPGVTGAWQISNRTKQSYADRVAIDVNYVDNQSLFLDIVLVLKTIPAILWPHLIQ